MLLPKLAAKLEDESLDGVRCVGNAESPNYPLCVRRANADPIAGYRTRFRGSLMGSSAMKSQKDAPKLARTMIDAITLDKVGAVARVCSGKEPQFRRFIRAAIDEAWSAASTPPKKSGKLASMSQSEARANTVYRTAVTDKLSQWRTAIETLKEPMKYGECDGPTLHARSLVRTSLARTKREMFSEFEQSFLSALDDVDAAISKANDRAEKHYRAKGRPPGPYGGNMKAQLFVRSLLSFARSCGGRLTVSRRPDGRASGTLLKVIHLLLPYLPAPLFPNEISVRFLEKTHAEDAADFRADRI